MAAVHGMPPPGPGTDPFHIPGEGRPSAGDRKRFWDQCQHQTWYFLPWHRGYLAAFESIVAKAVVDSGGPADWALPYWNYSEGVNSRRMPQAFCDEMIDGHKNLLWLPWGRTSDGDMGFSDEDISTECLNSKFFAGLATGGEVGFAGPVTGWMHFGGAIGQPNGRVEDAPHNNVHSQIGGLMGDPRYAALDPIFWLHHSNIDRLWEVWRRRNPGLASPTDGRWLSGETFEVHVADGAVWAFKPQDLLNTNTVLHGYEYDVLPEPVDVPLGGVLDMPEIASMRTSLAGASENPVRLAGGSGHTTVKIPNTVQSLSVLDETPRVYLNLENIRGAGETANYSVFVRRADSADEPVFAGQVSLFGLEVASDPEAGHGGSGLNKVIEISAIADRLELASPGATELDISFKRRERRTKTPDFVSGPGEPDVQIGRVSVFYAASQED